MRRKRIMVVGPTRCGKTSLVRRLDDDDRPLKRTPDIRYGKRTIDCPGSYVENTDSYKHLIATSQNASHILMLVDQSRPVQIYSPMFAKAFTKPVVGIISKSDLNPENRDFCIKQLELMGIEPPYYSISTLTDEGIRELKEILFTSDEI